MTEQGILTREQVLRTFRSMRRLPMPVTDIQCSSLSAVAGRDVLDLYLRASGAGSALWRDAKGNKEPVQPKSRAAQNLLRDIVALPQILRKAKRDIRKIESSQAPHRIGTIGEPRILYLSTDHWFGIDVGGAASHSAGLINAMIDRNCLAKAVSSRHLQGAKGDIAHCEPVYDLGRNLSTVPQLLYNDQIADYLTACWSDWQPTVVYQRMSAMSWIGPLLRARFNVPYICEYNGSVVWMAQNWEKQRLKRKTLIREIENLSLRFADLVVAVSDAAAEELISLGVGEDRICVCPNGVDNDRFTEPASGEAVRGRHDLGRSVVVGFVGTFGQWHGAEILVEAFADLLDHRPDLRGTLALMMVGDGQRRTHAAKVASDRGLADVAVFRGAVPQADIPAYLAACDILVCPHVPNPDGSKFSGSPTKLFEYMAAGKPIVASDLGQIGQILRHTDNGWLVAPGRRDSLAHALEWMIASPRVRARLGERARAEALALHGWDKRLETILTALPRASWA